MTKVANAALNGARHARRATAAAWMHASGTCERAKDHAMALLARTRPGRVSVAIARFAWKRLPKWLRRTLALCVAIPGPFDELAALGAVLVFTVGPLVVSRAARRELATAVATAWRAQ